MKRLPGHSSSRERETSALLIPESAGCGNVLSFKQLRVNVGKIARAVWHVRQDGLATVYTISLVIHMMQKQGKDASELVLRRPHQKTRFSLSLFRLVSLWRVSYRSTYAYTLSRSDRRPPRRPLQFRRTRLGERQGQRDHGDQQHDSGVDGPTQDVGSPRCREEEVR